MTYTTSTLHNAVTASGNGTTVDLADSDIELVVSISGLSTSDTIDFEATLDDSVWFAVQLYPVEGGAPVSQAAAAAGNGGYLLPAPVGRYTSFRAVLTRTTGTITVKARVGA